MTSQKASDPAPGVRDARGGRPPKLSRDRIVAAARALDPETLTMQAVAEALGVNRKSLNYYVCDRDGLLELIAFETFETEVAGIDLTSVTELRDLLRLFATAMATALIEVGVLIPYVQFAGRDVGFTGRAGANTLAVVERTVRSLMDAGFEAAEAGRTLKTLAVLAHSAAQEALDATRGVVEQREGPVLRTVDATVESDFPALRDVAAARRDSAGVGEQFTFDLELVLAGVELLLRGRGDRPDRPGPQADSGLRRR